MKMKTRAFLYMTVMSAAVVCSLLGSDPAFAQAASFSTPTNGWSVAPIPVKAETGARFCSMKADFSDGKALVFARDDQGSNSLALDFHQDMLDTVGRQYGVTLRVGALKRRVIGLAATRQILVLQTGMDTSLQTALAGQHQVSVEFQKMKYGFDLDVSAADAFRALGHCSDTLMSDSAFSPVSVPLGSVTVEKVEAVPQNADVTAPSNDVVADAAPPKKKKKKVAAVPAAMQEPVVTVKSEAATLSEQEVADLRARNRVLERENLRAQQAVNEMKSAAGQAVSQEEIAELRARNRALEQENAQVQEAAAGQARQKETAHAVSQEEIAALRARNRVLEQENLKVKEALHASLEVQNDVREELASAPPSQDLLSHPGAGSGDNMMQAAAPPPAPSVVSMVPDMSGLRSLLVAARVASTGDISTGADRSLHWTANNLYGSAQAVPLLPGKNLQDIAAAHIQQLSSLCKGDFAQKIRPAATSGRSDVVEADITCIDGQNDAAAALLFISHHGTVNVITQEGTVDQLDTAMLGRDALVSAAAGNYLN